LNGAARVAQIAVHRKWCGGVHVDHLSSLLGLRPGEKRLWVFIKQAQRAGAVDVWRGWVIADRAIIEKGKRS
jgi:hypothetical protein